MVYPVAGQNGCVGIRVIMLVAEPSSGEALKCYHECTLSQYNLDFIKMQNAKKQSIIPNSDFEFLFYLIVH